MIKLVLLLITSMAQQRTSVNSCTNEKSIFKLDIRQRVKNISPTSTLRDIDATALCQEAYLYDYLWLTQLWTPGKFSYYDVNGTLQKSQDNRELQSIKEYIVDPYLGSLTDLYLLQTNIKINCPHLKFLGEFSFYISQDSYLLQNFSRFLRRPGTDNFNIYDSRYDDDNYVWAFNDQMKTIPYAVQWNYFDPIKGLPQLLLVWLIRLKAGIRNSQLIRHTVLLNGSLLFDGDAILNNQKCYYYYEKDIIEIQYDPSIEQFIFKKYSVDYTNLQQLSMMIPGGQNNIYSIVNVQGSSHIQIKFPFQFSQMYKNGNLLIQNHQQITLISMQNLFYYGQIWPNINQNENMVTLNFQITYKNNSVIVGVCNQDILLKNNHQQSHTNPFGTGVYVWHSEGCIYFNQQKMFGIIHQQLLNNAYIGKKFEQDLISVSYIKQNQSISFFKNQVYQHSFPVDKVKNLNFCVALEYINSVVNLVY